MDTASAQEADETTMVKATASHESQLLCKSLSHTSMVGLLELDNAVGGLRGAGKGLVIG